MGKRLNSSFMFTSPLCTIILAIQALFHCYHNSKRKCKIGRIPNSHKISSDLKTIANANFAFAYQKLKESESLSHPSLYEKWILFVSGTNPQNTINIYPLLGNEKQTNDFQTSILRHFK